MSEARHSVYNAKHKREPGDILPLGRSPKALALIAADAADLDAITNAARERFGLPPLVRVVGPVLPDAADDDEAAGAVVVPRIKRGRYAREVMPAAQYRALRERALKLAAERPLLWQRLVVVGRISWEAMVAFRDDTRVLPLNTSLKLERVLNECYTLAVYRGGRKAGRKGKGLRS